MGSVLTWYRSMFVFEKWEGHYNSGLLLRHPVKDGRKREWRVSIMNCSHCKGNTRLTFQTVDLTEHQCIDCGRLYTNTKNGVVEWPDRTEPARGLWR